MTKILEYEGAWQENREIDAVTQRTGLFRFFHGI